MSRPYETTPLTYNRLAQLISAPSKRETVVESGRQSYSMPSILSTSDQREFSRDRSRDASRRGDDGRIESRLPHLVDNLYEPIRQLGKGSFGEVVLVRHVETGDLFALKIEVSNAHLLAYEARVLHLLRGKHRSIPNIHWFGAIGKETEGFVQDWLGDSLETIRERQGGRLELHDVLKLGMQAIDSLKYLHSYCFIHRDLKPENFLMGREGKRNILYLIDFGLAKMFKDPKTNVHIPFRENKSLTGTPRFASIDNHKGYEIGRKDDLEALAYILIYLAKGELPWQGIKVPRNVKDERKAKNRIIVNMKQSVNYSTLCKGCGECVAFLLEYSRRLRFYDKPDYGMLLDRFADEIRRRGWTVDWNFYFNEER